MSYLKSLVAVSFLLFIIFFGQLPVYGCFAVVVGKEASTDGSVLFGHLEQNGGLRNMSYRYVPRMQHDPGSMVGLRRGGLWPQVEETHAFLWTSNVGIEFSDGYFNEYGVAISSDACRTREDSYDELVARGDITDGGIGYKLRRIVAQRAKTSREGLAVATELIDHFGYVASGRTYVIADSREAWLLAVVRGKHWIAQRVPDDAIVLLPNVHITGPEADLTDTSRVFSSDGLVEYAIERGWYDPASGQPFSFREAFNLPPAEGSFMDKHGVDPRQWFSHSLVLEQHIELPAEDQLPFALYPDRKFGVQDLAGLLRSHGHLEGQLPDMGLSYKLGMPEDRSPHHVPGTGALCSSTVQEMVIYQLRSWMPPEVGCVAWRTTAAPCGSALVPWYAGITQTSGAYYKNWPVEKALGVEFQFNPPDGTFDYDPDNAFDIFTGLEKMIDLDYPENIHMVRKHWDAFEKEQFAMQEGVEEAALSLMDKDRELARLFLTSYSNARANEALTIANKLLHKLKTLHWAH